MRHRIKLLFGFLAVLFGLGDIQMWRIMHMRSLSAIEMTFTNLLFLATIAALIMAFGKIHFRTRDNYRLNADPALTQSRNFKFFRRRPRH